MEQYINSPIHQDDEGKIHFDEQFSLVIRDSYRYKYVVSVLEEANILNLLDSAGNTLLHFTAKHDNFPIVEYLIGSGSNIDAQNHLGKTPLMAAIENGSQFATEVLLKCNTNIFITDEEGKDALYWFTAAQWFDVSYLVSYFLKALQSQCHYNNEIIAKKLYNAGWPLSCLVKQLKNIEVIKIILELGCQVDACESDGKRTALHEAVISSDVKIVELLLDYGANPNAMDGFQRTPLYHVYNKDREHSDERLEIVKLLICKGALLITSSEDSSKSQVDHALKYGNKEVIQILLEANLDLSRKHKDEYSFGSEHYDTPVHIIAANQTPNAFKALENQNFKIDTRNSRSKTALNIAASYGNVCAVECLLKMGADVRIRNADLSSPLYQCVRYYSSNFESQYKQCVQLLLEYGADVQKELFISERRLSIIFDVLRKKESYSVAEILIAHLILQEAMGMEIIKQIYRRICSHSHFKASYDFFKQQLDIEIYKSATLLELLSESDVKFESYARDGKFALSIENFSNEWESNLYYFNAILQKKYAKALSLLRLREEAAVFICQIMKTEYFRFPLVFDHIVSYLDEQDLNNFLKIEL